jgi:hypothetical protein
MCHTNRNPPSLVANMDPAALESYDTEHPQLELGWAARNLVMNDLGTSRRSMLDFLKSIARFT